MASDFTLVDPSGWELDLHSVYSAYMGHFQLHNMAWYDRSWASLFASFDAFLAFGWPTVVVTDARTGRPHIVTRLTTVGAFVKMVKTRFGEVLPPLNNITMVQPFETSQRHLRTISDAAAYKKLFATLPAASLSARRVRVRQGDVVAIRKLWTARESIWLSVSCEVSERTGNIHAWGYSVLRAPHLEASGIWPPNPVDNYRKGYYVAAEAYERKSLQFSPRDFVWADANLVPRAKLSEIVLAIVSSLAGPESESQPNPLVLVTHGDSSGFAELKVKLPNNAFVVDVGVLERHMYAAGMRGNMPSRQPSTTLTLPTIMRSLDADLSTRGAPHGVAGNDAFSALLALQSLMGDAPKALPAPARPRFNQTSHSTPNIHQMLHPGMPIVGRQSMLAVPPSTLGSTPPGHFRGAALQNGPPSPRRAQPTQLYASAAGGSTSQVNMLGRGRTSPNGQAHARGATDHTPSPNGRSNSPARPQAATVGRTPGRSQAQKERRRASLGGFEDVVDAMGQLRT